MSNFFDGGTILVLLISIVLVGIFCTASGIMWWEEYKRELYLDEWMKLHGPQQKIRRQILMKRWKNEFK